LMYSMIGISAFFTSEARCCNAGSDITDVYRNDELDVGMV
jgi:hypothetical protein